MNDDLSYDLIVTIVPKGYAEEVIDASRKAGAEGATIIGGRGTGIHEHGKLFGIPIEPEKEIVFTLIDKEISDRVLESIVKAATLDQPCMGIAFVLDVKKVAGIFHACSL